MFDFLSTFGAESEFQRSRLIATKCNSQSPDETAIKNIIRTLKGEDQETRSQIAFACLVRKVHCSQSRGSWQYLLKNLLIFDRMVTENSFCHEIAELQLKSVDSYCNSDSRSVGINASALLSVYWNLIKKLSFSKAQESYIIFYKRSQRKAFIQRLSNLQLILQIRQTQTLFQIALELFEFVVGAEGYDQENKSERLTTDTIRNSMVNRSNKYYREWVQSSLATQICLLVFSKILNIFSCQYLCIHQYIINLKENVQNSPQINLQELKQFRKAVVDVRKNCDIIMVFALHKNLQKELSSSFGIDELRKFQDQNLLGIIDEFINHDTQVITEQEMNQAKHISLFRSNFSDKLRVDLKPFRSDSVTKCHGEKIRKHHATSPRLKKSIQQNQKQQENSQSDPFHSYFNEFSTNFPRSDMMTLDLIEHVREFGQGFANAWGQEDDSIAQQSDAFKYFCQQKETNDWSKVIKIVQEKPQSSKQIRSERIIRKSSPFEDLLSSSPAI